MQPQPWSRSLDPKVKQESDSGVTKTAISDSLLPEKAYRVLLEKDQGRIVVRRSDIPGVVTDGATEGRKQQ